MTAAAPSSAPPIAPEPQVPAPGAIAYGNDISWPQCPKRVGGHGLPGPMASASFAIVGLTDGGSFRANPCLASQVATVKARHLWIGAYAIVTHPTSAQLIRYGGTGTLAARLRRAGAAQADFNLATMAQVGLRSPMVWVDIEPRTRSPWSASTTNNNAVIEGAMARFEAAGVRAGIYSFNKAWKAITGGRDLPGVPAWVPVGHMGRKAAAARCAVPSFAGSRPWLTQWTDGVRDYNLTCPDVRGKAARGSLLTRYTYTPSVPGLMGAMFAPT